MRYCEKSFRFINLSYILARSEFKAKNSSGLSGLFWQIVNSLLMAGLLYLVFSRALGNDIKSYPAYLLIGVSIFNFFLRATTESSTKFISWGETIKNLVFPYPAIVFSVILEALFCHLIEMGVIIAFLSFISQINPLGFIFYLPVLTVLVIFIYGFSLLLALMTARLIDIGHFWRLVAPLLLFVTPIFYSIQNDHLLIMINFFNPLYHFITLARAAISITPIPVENLLLAIIFTLLAISLAMTAYKKIWIKLVERF